MKIICFSFLLLVVGCNTSPERTKTQSKTEQRDKALEDTKKQPEPSQAAIDRAREIINKLGENPDTSITMAVKDESDEVKTLVLHHYLLKPSATPTNIPSPAHGTLQAKSANERSQEIISKLSSNPRPSDILKALKLESDDVKALVQAHYNIKTPATPSSTPTSPAISSSKILPPSQRASIQKLNLIRVPDSTYQPPTGKSASTRLIRWVNNNIRDYGFVIKNLEGDMKNGSAFCALADILQDGAYLWCEDFKLAPGALKDSIRKAGSDKVDTYNLGNFARLYIAFHVLAAQGVSQLLDAEDIVETPDKQSIMTYLFKIQKEIESRR